MSKWGYSPDCRYGQGIMKMNAQDVTLLVMFDLSAAFDTVNHNFLLTRLNEELGIADWPWNGSGRT